MQKCAFDNKRLELWLCLYGNRLRCTAVIGDTIYDLIGADTELITLARFQVPDFISPIAVSFHFGDFTELAVHLLVYDVSAVSA